ncbi:cell cycle checkpoint control protein RAD9A [Anabrus simplex]|uniref:cell cycle checkpoint control protein RAD9A n=1 Tax=Anabrus simplex TaxID=316456 RepID=UPI0034DCF1E6
MKCTIPGANVKVLARAIHALSRIGDELYVEPEADKISFRSVNSSRSAYASFTFGKPFFAYYRSDVVEGPQIPASQEEDMKCKISMKSCLPVFRSPNTLDKQVETCLLRLEPDGSRLVLEMRCRHGVVKTHYMPIIECETLQVVYTKDTSAHQLAAHVRLYSDAVLNFQATQEEVTLAVTPSKTYLRSYSDDTLDPSKVIHTELCLEPGEFDEYKVTSEAAITFCLKEFRALLTFAEATSLPVEVNFETAGRPVVFVVNNAPAFEVNFVLATLSPELESQTSTPQPQPSRDTSKTKKANISSSSSRVNGSHNSRKKVPAPSSAKKNIPKEFIAPQMPGPPSLSRTTEQSRVSPQAARSDAPNRTTQPAQLPGPSSLNRTVEQLRNASRVTTPPSSSREKEQNHASQEASGSTSFMFGSTSLRQRESDEEEDSVPGTPPPPPNKRARFLFKRCFEATFNPDQIPGHDVVLADDSAEED